ncbi:MAG TPA: hypothetical protein PLU25_08635, partial [Acidobacteriota bacterium]|nr:hypothetical protein [Acidobacteriota bacterium]
GVTGAVMTGWAIGCLSAGYHAARRVWAPAVLLAVAAGLKSLDAAVLSLPVGHGSVANPMFAFAVQALLLMLVAATIRWAKADGRAVDMAAGGLIGLGAAGLFPLVGFVTGSPACIHAGTTLPVAVVYAPLSAALGSVAYPLGRILAERLQSWLAAGPAPAPVRARWLDAAAVAALVLFVGVELLAR